MKVTIRKSQIPIIIFLFCILFPKRMTVGPIYAYSLVAILGFIVMMLCKVKIKKVPPIKGFLLGCVLISYSLVMLYHNNNFSILFYIITPVLIIYGLICSNSDEKNWGFTIKLIQYIVILIAILSIIETITGLNIWDMISNYQVEYYGANGFRLGLIRARGPFETSINNAMFLILGQGFLWYGIINDKRRKTCILGLVISYVSIFLIMSRAAIIATAALAVILNLKGGIRKIPMRILKYTIIIAVLYYIVNFFNIEIVKDFINNISDSLRALIDSSYVDYNNGIGDAGQRTLLYGWVYAATAGHRLFGLGEYALFSHTVTTTFTKTSIENYYLWQFYKFGWIGLISILLIFVAYLVFTKIQENREKKLEYNNNQIMFTSMAFYLSIIYLVLNLTCAGQNDMLLFYVLIAMSISYGRNLRGVR